MKTKDTQISDQALHMIYEMAENKDKWSELIAYYLLNVAKVYDHLEDLGDRLDALAEYKDTDDFYNDWVGEAQEWAADLLVDMFYSQGDFADYDEDYPIDYDTDETFLSSLMVENQYSLMKDDAKTLLNMLNVLKRDDLINTLLD